MPRCLHRINMYYTKGNRRQQFDKPLARCHTSTAICVGVRVRLICNGFSFLVCDWYRIRAFITLYSSSTLNLYGQINTSICQVNLLLWFRCLGPSVWVWEVMCAVKWRRSVGRCVDLLAVGYIRGTRCFVLHSPLLSRVCVEHWLNLPRDWEQGKYIHEEPQMRL